MIQRIQTIYLLIVLALTVALYFVPFYHFEGKLPLNNLFIENYLVPIEGLMGLTCLAAIFLFRNRKLQKNICRALIIFQLAYISVGFIYVKQHILEFDIHSFGWGTLLPVINIVFIILAIAGINKDEELIRSMDRLR